MRVLRICLSMIAPLLMGGTSAAQNLDVLEVSNLTDEGVEDLIGNFQLKRLHLRASNLSDHGLKQLSRLDRLTELSFEATKGTITDDGIARLRSQLPDCRFVGDVQERTKDQDGSPVELELRVIGGEDNVPLSGIDITLTRGHGSVQKKFGPFRTDISGTAHVALRPGFYYLHLSSEKEWPFLPCEKYWNESSQGQLRSMQLWVTDLVVEKWLGGNKRDAGVEQPTLAGQIPRVTYTLIPACEMVLRAVDADTGKGLKGASFFVEVAAGEDWAHPIDGDNVGARSYFDDGNTHASPEYQTDEDGCFRRYMTEGGDDVKYGVWISPTGYEPVEPGKEVNIDTSFGKARAEHVFRFRRMK